MKILFVPDAQTQEVPKELLTVKGTEQILLTGNASFVAPSLAGSVGVTRIFVILATEELLKQWLSLVKDRASVI